MEENEELIGRLYTAYAERFTEHADFWLAVAADEKQHAAWLRQLGGKVGQGSLYVDGDRFKKRPTELFHQYVRDELARAGETDIPLRTALSVALSIEQALIERRFFEVFETDSVELKHVLQDLASATESHLKKVRDMWAEHRR